MKKVLSILLALSIFVSSFAVSSVALADDSVKVEYSVCVCGEFALQPTTLTVTADLSDKYGYEDTINTPSILDATIAAHIEMFGEDFANDGMLAVSGSWTTVAFGVETSALTYRLNGCMDDGKGNYYNYNTPVKSNDYVEYMFYQDDIDYSDVYSSFDTRSRSAMLGKDVTLSLSAEGYDSNGNTVSNHLSDYIEKTNASAMKFLMANVKSLTVDNATDYLTYLDSGYDMSAYKNAFLDSVKANLDNNAGKLLNAYGADDLGLYGAIIQILDRYDMDARDFYGYDIISAFEGVKPNQISNPYLYRTAIMSADEKFARAMCDEFIKNYYVMGKGMNYWGFSCDNTAMLLTAIAPYADDYKNVVEDAKDVIASYTTDDGCFYSADYTGVNPDSTAVALMAYASLGENDKALSLYQNLKSFESDTLGVMLSYGDKNEYATKEAVLALEYLDRSINDAGYDEHLTRQVVAKTATTKASGVLADKCYICGEEISTKAISSIKSVSLSNTSYTYTGKAITPKVTIKNAKGYNVPKEYYTVKYSNNKSVGTATVIITLNGRYSGTITRTFKINPTKPTGVKLVSGKKKFTVKMNSSKATGYQIEYTKSKTTKKISTKYTKKVVKNLKKGKYSVRVRAYKTVDGKKYYSAWTKAKTVTVK